MKNSIIAAVGIIVAISTLICCNLKKIEGFTADGWVLTRPSEWWFPQKYKNVDWLVPMYLDQLSQPSCLPYNRGNPGPLNFNASAYRFWRF